MNTFTYKIGNNLYINLTNRCSNRCTFCVRDQSAQYEGYSLWLDSEPSVEDVVKEIGDPTQYEEVVFCGYGEPTYRLDAMLCIASHVKRRGGKTRLNTNGHGNLIHGRDITPQLAGVIDLVNISLNAPDKMMYDRLCRPVYRDVAFDSVLFFARDCKKSGVCCRFSVVDCIGKECVEQCRALADREGIPLYVREMIHNG